MEFFLPKKTIPPDEFLKKWVDLPHFFFGHFCYKTGENEIFGQNLGHRGGGGHIYIYIYMQRHFHANDEQRHFYANEAKTKMRQFCLKHYKTRHTPVKWDRIKKKSKTLSASRMRSERDMNLHIWGHEGTRQGCIPVYTSISLLERQMSWKTSKTRCTPEKRDRHEFR